MVCVNSKLARDCLENSVECQKHMSFAIFPQSNLQAGGTWTKPTNFNCFLQKQVALGMRFPWLKKTRLTPLSDVSPRIGLDVGISLVAGSKLPRIF